MTLADSIIPPGLSAVALTAVFHPPVAVAAVVGIPVILALSQVKTVGDIVIIPEPEDDEYQE